MGKEKYIKGSGKGRGGYRGGGRELIDGGVKSVHLYIDFENQEYYQRQENKNRFINRLIKEDRLKNENDLINKKPE